MLSGTWTPFVGFRIVICYCGRQRIRSLWENISDNGEYAKV
ncbi:hypothetical protein PG2093B_0564 [Bifidobacterium pseudolongum subsp. globosum]|uniref:Uncharacterized protein n=1 Tax=Bifidobacterium pseudolongum subsp. globosum TaxID=1690 RepID=A0A4Q5A0V1_9BIFI|nr:hypothetical protein PG2093B_0564 [Bifidobacterium pseudolongum subsp. globosum]